MEERALAAAAGSKNEDEFAATHPQRNVAEHRVRFALIRVGYVGKIDHDLGIETSMTGAGIRVRAVRDAPCGRSVRIGVEGARAAPSFATDALALATASSRLSRAVFTPSWAGRRCGRPPLPWRPQCRAARPP